MLRNVSHEFRTPLNCIISMLQLVGSEVSQEIIDKYINPAIFSSEQLMSLLNDILDKAQVKKEKKIINNLYLTEKEKKTNLIFVIIKCDFPK